MSDAKDPQRYYFSTHHLARDFIGTAAPLSFFVVVTLLIFERPREMALEIARGLTSEVSWLSVTAVLVTYFLFAFFAGALANRVALFLRDHLEQKLPWAKEIEYSKIYKHGEGAIKSLYDKYIVATGPLWANPNLELLERIDRLCHFFKLHNPAGFQQLYRDYSFVFMYRQAGVYASILLIVCLSQQRWLESCALAILCCAIVFAIKAGVREAVNSEYQFIFATASWIDQRDFCPNPAAA